MYNEQQFFTAYTAVVHMLHGLRHVDTEELMRWIRETTKADQEKPAGKETVERHLRIMAAVHNLRETLKVEGIPVIPKQQRRPSAGAA